MTDENRYKMIEEHGGLFTARDLRTGEIVTGTMSGLSVWKPFYDATKHHVWVLFEGHPTAKDAAKLRQSLTQFADKSIPEVLHIIGSETRWFAGIFLRRQGSHPFFAGSSF